jgi:uncharacterized protein
MSHLPPPPVGVDERVVGLISDTHGLLRPEALAVLTGCERIVHAGDVGTPGVLDGLGRIAPVVAVRGNVDRGPWADRLPATQVAQVDAIRLYVIHDLATLDLDPAAAGFAVVVSGHSHTAGTFERGGVLFVNPGSAGPRRFKQPVSLALARIRGDSVRVEIVVLEE